MGRATRWLRSLLRRKKDPEVHKDNASTNGYEMKDRKRRSFARPRQAESMCSSPVSATEAAWLRSFYDDTEEESKHVMAVAVATAAAANAAVTAAQAAMVRLKSLGREGTTPCNSYQWWAAVKIQTAFRCYLGRDRCRHIGLEQSCNSDASPKILEMDTIQLRSKSFRRTSSNLDESMVPISSPLPYKVPARLSISSCRNPDKSPYSKTAQNTPRLRPETPARSRTADMVPRQALSPSSCPNYMANTSSFAAKVRPQSTPKQRPEKAGRRKKALASETESRTRSPLRAHDAYHLYNGTVGKLDDRSAKILRKAARDHYIDCLW
ncbi:hypothetical protein BHE74_00029746 [Ensete ventricosum]|nr:hypothetical protein BHE74_00029746 [Ensete ventricosum]